MSLYQKDGYITLLLSWRQMTYLQVKVKLSDKEIKVAIEKYGFPDVLDYICGLCNFDSNRTGNHISWWTHDKIFKFLKNAGFENIYRSGYGQSSSPLLRHSKLFDSTHPQMSIYVEAIR